MSYVQDNLMSNEKILFSAKVSLAVLVPALVVFIATIAFFACSFSSMSQVASQVTASGADESAPSGAFLTSTAMSCLGVLAFMYSVFLAIQAIFILFTTEFAVTNRRIIAKAGFIRRHTLEMLLTKIESVSVNQGIAGRIFNFGTIVVIGTGGTRESFNSIVKPLETRKSINQIIEQLSQASAPSG